MRSHDKLNKYRKISLAPSSSSQVPVETMSRDFLREITGVFWDVRDCPIPHDHDPYSVYKIIQSSLETECCCRRDETMEIKVYGGKKDELSQELRYQYLRDGLYYQPEVSSGDTSARIDQMSRDILLWEIDHPEPSNLMVIGKTISQDKKKIRRVLEAMKSRDHKIIFVQPDMESSKFLLPLVHSLLLWKDLFDTEKSINVPNRR